MTQASDLSARLLAQENLMVHRGAVRTASFDIKNRVLVLPNWRDMTKECEDLMIGHEVGHALYTDREINGKSIHEMAQERNIPFGYINIVEDARIERMIKDKYPGIRSSFFRGYRELWDKGFFGADGANVNTYSLIDRINLYFKVGIPAGVKFTPEEKLLVKRVESTQTIEEVFTVAEEILTLAKKQFEENKLRFEADLEEAEDDVDEELDMGGDFDIDGDFDEEYDPDLNPSLNSKAAGKKNEQEFKADDTLRTQATFDRRFEDLADTDIVFTNVTLQQMTEADCDKFVVPYGDVLDRINKYPFTGYGRYTQSNYDKTMKGFDQYMIQSNRVVNYLLKEFELKKSADLYRRARKSKTGSLDISKLYNYKFAEDIFKRVTILPQGKNHGMVMLVDWSGSMSNQANDTVKQIFSLVSFCKRAHIPFRVYAFTTQWLEATNDDGYEAQLAADRKHRADGIALRNNLRDGSLVIGREFRLLELFSDKMRNNEIVEVAKTLFAITDTTVTGYGVCWIPGMELGGTPLNESLAWASSYLRIFKAKYALDRLSFILISDGAGGSMHYMAKREEGITMPRDTAFRVYAKKTVYTLTSDVTQKGYPFHCEDSIEQTNGLISHINDIGVDTIGIFLERKTVRGARCALETFVYRTRESRKDRQAIEVHALQMVKEMKDHDVATIPKTKFAKMFLVPITSIKPIDEIEVDSSTSAKSVASKFSKFMTRQRTSKVFLDKFIEEIA